MLKTILVPVDGSNCDAVSLDTAYLAAEPFGSHIHCLYVGADPRELLAQSVSLDAGVSVITPELWDALNAEAKSRKERARSILEEFCNRKRVSESDVPGTADRVTTTWQEVSGDPVHHIVRHARIRDLLVLARSAAAGLSLGQLGEVLVRCGRPVVLSPPVAPKMFATTVAIAWKETAEAARALTAAMPLLAKAQSVLILSADEGGGNVDVTTESAERLLRSLRWDGIQAELHRIVPSPQNLPGELLDVAFREGANLLVMGAYSHSRARELIFGGATRHVLLDARLPVFLCH